MIVSIIPIFFLTILGTVSELQKQIESLQTQIIKIILFLETFQKKKIINNANHAISPRDNIIYIIIKNLTQEKFINMLFQSFVQKSQSEIYYTKPPALLTVFIITPQDFPILESAKRPLPISPRTNKKH